MGLDPAVGLVKDRSHVEDILEIAEAAFDGVQLLVCRDHFGRGQPRVVGREDVLALTA